MKFLKVTFATAAIAAFSMSAQAQDTGVYINAGIQTFEFDTYNIVGRVGYNFSEIFGVEAEGSFGIAGSEEDFGIDFDTPYSFGGYLIGRYPVSEQFEFFGRIGYAGVNVELSDDFNEFSDTLDGFAGGIGIQYNLDQANGVRLGYTAVDGDGASADVIDLVYVRKF